MEPLIIPQTAETPEVMLNATEGSFKFSGKSYPENVNDFFGDVIKYLENYTKDPRQKTELEFYWVYYNTATSKILVKIIQLLKTVTNAGKNFKIKWYIKPNDDLMLEKGEELKELLDVDFDIIYL